MKLTNTYFKLTRERGYYHTSISKGINDCEVNGLKITGKASSRKLVRCNDIKNSLENLYGFRIDRASAQREARKASR